MPDFRSLTLLMAGSLGVLGGVALDRSVSSAGAPLAPPLAPFTNQAFIDGLYSDLDLEDPDAVFGHVFASLPGEVTIYPSEGYYYFAFPARGLIVKGTLLFSVLTRDQGVIELGYVGEVQERPDTFKMELAGRAKDYGLGDGLQVEVVDDFHSLVTYQGKTVRFRFYDPSGDGAPPLAEDEVLVGNTMDESGLRFHLVFDRSASCLFWVLNENAFVPETFCSIGECLAYGARTRFAFFLDESLGRKLLMGVHSAEVGFNSWYDGPFDQLPDIRIKRGEVDFKDYLVRHTGLDPARLDRYGFLVNRVGVRIPPATYWMYEERQQLEVLEQRLRVMGQDSEDERDLRLKTLINFDQLTLEQAGLGTAAE